MNGDDPHTSPDATDNWKVKLSDSDDPDSPQHDEPSVVHEDASKVDTDLLPAPDDAASDELAAKDAGVSWTASEFIAHEKGITWYLELTVVTVVITAVTYLLTKDKVSSAVLVLAAVIFGVYGARKPRTLEYRLNESGLSVAGKKYGYDQFRSFWTAKDGAFPNITFMPLKRFMPSLTIYYSPQDEKQIMEVLAQYLPMENRDRDLLDRFLHRIRF